MFKVTSFSSFLTLLKQSNVYCFGRLCVFHLNNTPRKVQQNNNFTHEQQQCGFDCGQCYTFIEFASNCNVERYALDYAISGRLCDINKRSRIKLREIGALRRERIFVRL